MAQPATSLADGPAPTREQWLAAASRALKGAPLDSLITRTVEGLEIEPLYGPDPMPGRTAVQARCPRGEPAWDIRAAVAHADPAAANAQILEHLAGGASSVLLKLDPAGLSGCAVTSAADMKRALEGVVLEAATVALDAGFLGRSAAGWLAEAARGSPAARLNFHLDPLTAFAEAGASPGPMQSHIEAAAADAAGLARIHPEASLFLASGLAVHEAGGPAALELAVMTASALAYAKALAAAGLMLEQAFGAVTLGLAVDGECLTSVARLRAARDLWGRLTSACGAPVPARIEARGSRRMLTAMDPWTNLIRLTAAGFAAAVGGADAVALPPFTDPLGAPAALARRLSPNIQLILMHECGLGHVSDPLAGAWAVEALTEALAREAWGLFQEIERQGGALAALESGFIAERTAATREAREAAIADERLPILGVTLFPEILPTPIGVDAIDAAAFAKPAPDVGLPGPDSRCPPLRPWRLAETAETLVRDLIP